MMNIKEISSLNIELDIVLYYNRCSTIANLGIKLAIASYILNDNSIVAN